MNQLVVLLIYEALSILFGAIKIAQMVVFNFFDVTKFLFVLFIVVSSLVRLLYYVFIQSCFSHQPLETKRDFPIRQMLLNIDSTIPGPDEIQEIEDSVKRDLSPLFAQILKTIEGPSLGVLLTGSSAERFNTPISNNKFENPAVGSGYPGPEQMASGCH